MLVLGRKEGQSIQIGEATVTIVRIDGDKVRVGITAPKEIQIARTELLAKRLPHPATQLPSGARLNE